MGFTLTAEQLALAEAWDAEAQRLKGITKNFFGDNLINAGLNGRPATSENVAKLWHLVTRALSDGVKAMSFENAGIQRFWNSIYHNLRKQGWSDQQLTELRDARPWWTGSVIDEIEEEEAARKQNVQPE